MLVKDTRNKKQRMEDANALRMTKVMASSFLRTALLGQSGQAWLNQLETQDDGTSSKLDSSTGEVGES